MAWLLEKPLFIVVMGLLTAAVLGGLWMQTGRRSVFYALAAALVLTGLLLALERAVETDREQIESTLYHIARDVERNDLEAVLRHAHSEAKWIRRQASDELPRYDFQDVNIKSNLTIRLESDEDPRQAVAEFNVVVVLSDRLGFLKDRRIPRFVIVTFLRENGDWRVTDYEHHDPREGLKRRD
jgi:uncharacterized membrane protein YhiD involved in acid resistance